MNTDPFSRIIFLKHQLTYKNFFYKKIFKYFCLLTKFQIIKIYKTCSNNQFKYFFSKIKILKKYDVNKS